ncbi:MAG: glycerol kinase, partial [Candidatus Omnitrophica bacterium CG07_land_8_20_14_0_80_50_8]
MKKDTRQGFKILRADGGASANNFLMQFQADILGIPVERPRVLETTALGAAGLAGLAIGFWKNRNEFNRLRRVDRIFYPRMRRSEARALYARWRTAVERSKGWAL